jgi:hypothetical protein
MAPSVWSPNIATTGPTSVFTRWAIRISCGSYIPLHSTISVQHAQFRCKGNTRAASALFAASLLRELYNGYLAWPLEPIASDPYIERPHAKYYNV